MSIANKFNKAKFNFVPDSHTPFINLENLYKEQGSETVHTVHAIYINGKSKYGEHPVVAIDGFMVDMPKHLTDIAKDIIADDDAVMAINNQNFGFIVYMYTKNNKTCFSVNWVDC